MAVHLLPLWALVALSKLNIIFILLTYLCIHSVRGTLLVAQMVEALRYKSEGRRFDSRWCHWNF